MRGDGGAGRDGGPHRGRPRPAPVRPRQGRPLLSRHASMSACGLFEGPQQQHGPIPFCRCLCGGARSHTVLNWPKCAARTRSCGASWPSCAARCRGSPRLHPRRPRFRRATVAPVRAPVLGTRGRARVCALSDLRCCFWLPFCPPSVCLLVDSCARRAGARCRQGAGRNAQGQADMGLSALHGVHSQMRCDLDAQLRLNCKDIGDGGAAAIARALASNRAVSWVCVQHRVPAWWQPCGTHAHRWHLSLPLRACASRRCEQLGLDNNGIGAAGALALADALMANSTLRELWLFGNSIGDEGAAALARALATNHSLQTVCMATGGPQWVGIECWRRPLLCTHTSTSLPRHSSVMVVVVAQLGLGGNCIGDAGISALVGALAANDKLELVCDEAAQRCGLHVRVRVSCPHWLCTAQPWQIS